MRGKTFHPTDALINSMLRRCAEAMVKNKDGAIKYSLVINKLYK